MITPKSHPSYFREEAVGPYTYFVPIYHSIGLDEDIADAQYAAWRDAYKVACPDELIDGKVDPAKFLAWRDDDGKAARKVAKAVATLLFLPKDNAPAIDSEEGWYSLSTEQFASVRSFTKPKSQDSTNGQAISATNSSSSPASEIQTSANGPLPS